MSTPTPDQRIAFAKNIAVQYGGIDGAHHKDWVIDQMVRALCGVPCSPNASDFPDDGENDEYRALVRGACEGQDGPDTYSWDIGIAP